MIVIAESGSTKCDWIVLNDSGESLISVKTIGFNPYFHNETFILDHLNANDELLNVSAQVSRVFFYGAGCSSSVLNSAVEKALGKFFAHANIEVDHDLVAAAYALYDHEPIIACIIGTGSNSCFFDGQKAHEQVPALGFILGDEASGSYFGKKLLADYFYHRLPQDLHLEFKEKYQLKWSEVVNQVYQNQHANVYLASFMQFFNEHRTHPYVSEMVRDGMARFIDVHITTYANYHKFKVGFVGTIAHLFQEILVEELKKRQCIPGPIIKSPINALVDYHFKHLLQSNAI